MARKTNKTANMANKAAKKNDNAAVPVGQVSSLSSAIAAAQETLDTVKAIPAALLRKAFVGEL